MYQTEKVLAEEAKEMRAVFAEVMEELAQQDGRVVYLDADVINSIGMTGFWKAHPERTVNCGIQEANMIGAAAGMSATGLIPFVHTFGPFATRRVMDQVFLSAAYAKLNVRIIGSDPGVTASTNGGTHMPFEDMGMMRCIPEVTVLAKRQSCARAASLRFSRLAFLLRIRCARRSYWSGRASARRFPTYSPSSRSTARPLPKPRRLPVRLLRLRTTAS